MRDFLYLLLHGLERGQGRAHACVRAHTCVGCAGMHTGEGVAREGCMGVMEDAHGDRHM